MPEVKWIKLDTNLFDHRKIKRLRLQKEGDSYALLWVLLLTLAGQANAGGRLMMTSKEPYTTEDIAAFYGFPLPLVEEGLSLFLSLEMIEIEEGRITLLGWEEHQSVEGMEKIKEQNRLRKQKQRERENGAVTLSRNCHADVTPCHATDIDKEKEIEIQKESVKEKTAAKATATPKHKYGEYENVLLCDEEHAKLQAEFPDLSERIERLSAYMASKGARYKSHYATIRAWAKQESKGPPGYGQRGGGLRGKENTGYPPGADLSDLDDLFDEKRDRRKSGSLFACPM